MSMEATDQSWTPHALVYDLQVAMEPQVSPDGARLVYALAKADPTHPENPPFTRLWTCRIDGSEPRALTGIGRQDSRPRWSPDGERIAFVSARGGGSTLRVMRAGGGDAAELTFHAQAIDGIAWSPDGLSLAYVVPVEPADAEAGRGRLVRVTRRRDYKEDVRGYLGDVRLQIFLVDVETGERRQLTETLHDHRHPDWSPDGRMIAVHVSKAVHSRSHLELLSPQGERHAIISLGDDGVISAFSWSPSGDRLLLVGEPTRTSQSDLHLYHVGPGTLERLTDDLAVLPDAGTPNAAAPSRPVWLDDERLLLHAFHRGGSGLHVYDLAARELTALTEWQARHTGLSADRAARVFAQAHSNLESAGEICVFERDTGRTTTVTQHNGELFSHRPQTCWERFEVRRGELAIDAWLLFPPGFDPERPYPVILDIHGGPHSFYGYDFSHVQQCLASHGFLVVYANPRGSGSYGRDFATRVLGDWGGEDYRDLLAVIDEVLDRPYADPERVGVYGYSYGGYMTAWIIGHTDRFKAAVCGAPCFDLISMYGTSDIGPWSGPIEFGARPHEDPEWFRQRSPSTYAHGATTPTLLLHGEADERCPVGQGEQMFTALSQAGCEVEFVRYPGAHHLFFRAGVPGQREDFLQRVLRWFQEHL